jgi:hypothetical protein
MTTQGNDSPKGGNQMSNAIVQQATSNGALNASHYQTFEMAKANDTILGGDDIAQIRSYAAFARAQAQAIHKSIATMGELDDVAQAKAEMTETSQTFAKVSVYADQRIGEILRELPKAKNQHDSLSSAQDKQTKTEAINEAGITRSQAYDLQAMAANPEVVEAVIAKAEEEGKVVSRSQVLKAIKERDEARKDLQDAYLTSERLGDEVDSLKEQLSKRPKPEVIERTVEVEVESQESKRRIAELERENRQLNDEYQQMWKKKRELDTKLDQANELLGEKGKTREAQRDIEYLTMQINKLLHQHGGKVWAFDQFYRVDEVTQQEFIKAITSLAAFAQNVAAMVSERKQENS